MVNDIKSFLALDDVIMGLSCTCKRSVLKKLSDHIQDTSDVDATALFDALLAREQLGSTALGAGVAVPHARVNVPELRGVMMRLEEPIDFDTPDNQPVDLIFLLLAPETGTAEHLKALSKVARAFRNDTIRQAVRGAADAGAVYSLLTQGIDAEAA